MIPGQGSQLHRDPPRLGSRDLDAEPKDFVVVAASDPIEQSDPGRDLGDVVLDAGDQGRDLVRVVWPGTYRHFRESSGR
jgi:hypothetical protein